MSQVSAVDLFRQAMAASKAGNKGKTRECLQDAVRLDPNSETSWQWLATVLDDPADATLAWERVLALNPNNDKAKASIRPMRLAAGISAAKAKDVPTARRLLRAVVADEPKNEHGWLWLASVCDSPTEARAHLERVLTLNPASVAARKGIAYYDGKIEKQQAAAAEKSSSSTRLIPPVPAAQVRPSGTVAVSPAGPLDPPSTPGEPGRVLVVDASRTYRKLIGMVVAVDGYTMVEAEDADEAIDRIRDDGVPDLIVLDSRIAGMDAYAFCRLLREHPETELIPVVLLVAADAPPDRQRGRAAGVTATLAKPLMPDGLLTLLRQHARAPELPVA
jgi:CheY-like chemotaxis protein